MKDIVAKRKESEAKIKEAMEIIATATPNSNKIKKAKAVILKHEKLLAKYKKLRQKALTFNHE